MKCELGKSSLALAESASSLPRNELTGKWLSQLPVHPREGAWYVSRVHLWEVMGTVEPWSGESGNGTTGDGLASGLMGSEDTGNVAWASLDAAQRSSHRPQKTLFPIHVVSFTTAILRMSPSQALGWATTHYF